MRRCPAHRHRCTGADPSDRSPQAAPQCRCRCRDAGGEGGESTACPAAAHETCQQSSLSTMVCTQQLTHAMTGRTNHRCYLTNSNCGTLPPTNCCTKTVALVRIETTVNWIRSEPSPMEMFYVGRGKCRALAERDVTPNERLHQPETFSQTNSPPPPHSLQPLPKLCTDNERSPPPRFPHQKRRKRSAGLASPCRSITHRRVSLPSEPPRGHLLARQQAPSLPGSIPCSLGRRN